MSASIQPYQTDFKEQLISVWEKSVRDTHDFLRAPDIDYYKEIVNKIDFTAFPVYCVLCNDAVIGFIAVADKKIEMLFISPEYTRKGYGQLLIDYARKQLFADTVDVNEQNLQAVNFYVKNGFIRYDRTDTDSEGKPYPILKMKFSKS